MERAAARIFSRSFAESWSGRLKAFETVADDTPTRRAISINVPRAFEEGFISGTIYTLFLNALSFF